MASLIIMWLLAQTLDPQLSLAKKHSTYQRFCLVETKHDIHQADLQHRSYYNDKSNWQEDNKMKTSSPDIPETMRTNEPNELFSTKNFWFPFTLRQLIIPR
ncbi:uncharacterized protein LOC143526954 isoform X2 [Brachyhypopomus gauderio]|uniref:uncharacterized protein LOC143526954 isoform X2 n=1 Tax=Brachyhypopomus gauderio TaxID=698409 RepID=UPI0040431B59